MTLRLWPRYHGLLFASYPTEKGGISLFGSLPARLCGNFASGWKRGSRSTSTKGSLMSAVSTAREPESDREVCKPVTKEKEKTQKRKRREKSPFSKGVDPCNCFQTQLSRGILSGHYLSQNLLLLRPTNYRLPYPLNRIANYCHFYERKL